VAALTFRYAEPDDVPAVAALVERAYRGPEAEQGWTTESHLLVGPRTALEEVAALVTEADSRFVLGEADGVLVGCAHVRRSGDGAHFGMFAVDPGLQTQGVGRAVLAECERTARELWGARTMTMGVISLRSELIAWYERRGYARTGASEPFPFAPERGALRSDFDLVQLRKAL
jgi:ribosomal protein S18 acetylase RimI-like enzyme